MPSLPSGAGVPSHTSWAPLANPESEEKEQDNIYDASDEEDDDLCGTPIQIKTPDRGPSQVDQYSNPPESPEEFRMEYVKENGITGFMIKVTVSQVATALSRFHKADEGCFRAG